jgi:hypothetical protein
MRTRWISGSLVAGTLATLIGVKLRETLYVASISKRLLSTEKSTRTFTKEMVEGLPDPARRYFLRAIAPGTPLATQIRWTYSGEMKPGKDLPWLSLRAKQIIVSGRGFLWEAFAHKSPLFVTAVDHYLDGNARMRISLFGLIPFINASGEDLTKSALGRLLIEGFAMPSTLLPGDDVTIESIDDSRFTITIALHGEQTPITIAVDERGRPQTAEMPRWGNLTSDGSYQYIPYGVTFLGERTIDGYTIPTELAVGWWYGTPDYLEVVRIRIDDVQFS